MCWWQKCPEAEAAESDAKQAWAELDDLLQAVEDHRRGLVDDADLYAILDRERLKSVGLVAG